MQETIKKTFVAISRAIFFFFLLIGDFFKNFWKWLKEKAYFITHKKEILNSSMKLVLGAYQEKAINENWMDYSYQDFEQIKTLNLSIEDLKKNLDEIFWIENDCELNNKPLPFWMISGNFYGQKIDYDDNGRRLLKKYTTPEIEELLTNLIQMSESEYKNAAKATIEYQKQAKLKQEKALKRKLAAKKAAQTRKINSFSKTDAAKKLLSPFETVKVERLKKEEYLFYPDDSKNINSYESQNFSINFDNPFAVKSKAKIDNSDKNKQVD